MYIPHSFVRLIRIVLVSLGSLFISQTIFSLSISDVWINEIHYANGGVDTGEFIEIAGIEGIDLTGLSLVQYNGNGGGGGSILSLSGDVLDNFVHGIGFIDISTPGIQNGSPDGVALIFNSTVLQFLSYEGAFQATDGPANGMMSEDIGVRETDSSSNPPGSSLQLIGNIDSGFTWSGPSPTSRGSINAGQTFTRVPSTANTLLLMIFGFSLLNALSRKMHYRARIMTSSH